MKLTRIYSGIMALVMGALVLTACSKDDSFTAYDTPLLNDGSVVTGSSDVTATSAIFHGSVTGLESANTASYTAGFKYGFAENALTETVAAPAGTEFSSTLTGLQSNTVMYYQAFVTLQGKMTYTGEVKSLITTDAKAITEGSDKVDFTGATLSGSIQKAPEDAVDAGFVIAVSSNEEDVRAGLRLSAGGIPESFTYNGYGLLPATTYYYAAYLDLGPGVVYGEVKSFTTDVHAINVDEEFVDLGLSVKWAKHNIGAKEVYDLGGHFGFGDLTGINPSIDPADYASSDTYKTANDLAYVATGGKGTLPTADLFEELFSLCTVTFTEQQGVSGYQITGPNGNSIFLPAAGKRVGDDIVDENAKGYYLTGSVNVGNPQFAVDYEFSATAGTRATRAVYEALSVRPVSVARNIPFDKTQLYQKWYLDNGQDGKQHVFEGPFTQWGVTDTYGTVTNNEPNPYQDIHWEMGKDNGWIGYTYGRDYGYMEFLEDGTMNVHRLDAEGNATDVSGHYTIDENNQTITTDIEVLAADTWLPTKSGKLNILSLTEDGLQIALPADDTYAYSLNFYSQTRAKKDEAIVVSLICVGSDWNGSWGSQMDAIAPEDLDGQHTFTYLGACNGLKVNTIDFVGLKTKFPKAFVRIDDIKLDGTSIKFNANNFCYGDIENSGNYRIELANVWGKGAANERIIASPFSNLTDTDNDPAFTFANSLEITYTIFTDGPEKTFTPNLITINPSWGGTWGFNQGETFDVVLNTETAKYELSKSTFDILYTSGDHADGSIMTFIEIVDLFGYFPGTHAVLNSCKLDGASVSYDAAKVVDTNEESKYRLELWNTYGATRWGAGCGFGEPDGDVIHELSFSNTMELNFTIKNLFAVPQF